jgi:hypothetical protein
MEMKLIPNSNNGDALKMIVNSGNRLERMRKFTGVPLRSVYCDDRASAFAIRVVIGCRAVCV